MQGNFVLIQMNDLRKVVIEIIEEVYTKYSFEEKPSVEEGEWLTRDEVCDMLHITYTTLWRMEKYGKIKKHKIGRRNLYSKRDVNIMFCTAVEPTNNK